MVALLGKEDNRTGTFACHFSDQRIFGVKHCGACWRDDINNAALDLGKLLERIDVRQPQMISLADVRHDGYIAAVESKPFAKNAAARRFEHRRFDTRVQEHAARTLWPAAIAVVDPPAA